LHDLRHTAAVHRVVAWYREGRDVQRLLPQLATYLGHSEIKSTQRYLSMTPELLNEAGQRFAAYAGMGGDHA
jgi:integrase/recombinase XerD